MNPIQCNEILYLQYAYIRQWRNTLSERSEPSAEECFQQKVGRPNPRARRPNPRVGPQDHQVDHPE